MSQQHSAQVSPHRSAGSVDAWGDRLMGIVWRKPPVDLAERTRRRTTLHLIPFLFVLYILAYLDRINISVAGVAMKVKIDPSLPIGMQGLGFTKSMIGFGSSIFFWGYWILEIPSTLSVSKWGARWVFVRILILWGLCAALVGLVGLPMIDGWFRWLPETGNWNYFSVLSQMINGLRHGDPEQQFYLFRFLLGFFEGGFFPSVIVYLSMWFRQQDRAKAISVFMAAIPVSGVLGMPISTWVRDHIHWFDLAGWRWVYIIEGIVPVLAGIATIFMLPRGPNDATWLPEEERSLLTQTLAAEHAQKVNAGHGAWIHHLGMVLLLTGVYFCLNVASYGLSTFMPMIIEQQSGLSAHAAGYLSTLPYLAALIAMLLNGWHSDKTGERVWHVAGSLATLSVGLLAAYLLFDHPVAAVSIMICVVGSCWYAHLPAFWPIPTMFLGAVAAASAIGFINMVGNLGGSLGPALVGEKADRAEALQQSASAPAHLTPGVADASGAAATVELGQQTDLAPATATVELQPDHSLQDALLALSPFPLIAAATILAVGLYRQSRTKPLICLLTLIGIAVGGGLYYRVTHPLVKVVPPASSSAEPARR